MKFVWGMTAALLAAMPALAASPFDGTWKADIASAKLPTKPIHMLLKNGVYTCDCSTPTTIVKADGAFHAVAGHHYADEIAVKVDDPKTITETGKLKGKMVMKSITRVSADGQSLTNDWTDYSAPNGKPMTGSDMSKRVGPVPAGAHAISGAWQATKVNSESDATLVAKVRLDGKKLSFWYASGIGYDAMLDGPAVPLKGDPSNVMVQVASPKPNTIVETDTRGGKLIGKSTMVLAVDNRSMTVASMDAEHGTTMSYVVKKQ